MTKTIALVTTAHRTDDVRIYRKEALSLARNGWKVTIIGPGRDCADGEGVRFLSVQTGKGRADRLLFSRGRILSAIERSGEPLLILHDPELLPLMPLLHNMGRRVIYDSHEDLPDSVASREWIPAALRPAAGAFAGRLLSRYLPSADGVLAATEPIARRLREMGFSPELVRNRLTREETELFERELLRQTPLPGTVCYCGAISERRGASRMIRACFQAGAILLLAGRFETDTLRERLEQMPEYRCVRYEGVLDRAGVARLYARSQAGLLLLDDTPAYRESEPIKLFEYLAAGLPVVASDFPVWKTFGAGPRIRFCDPADAEAAARAIRETLADSGACAQIRFGRRAMQKQFSFEPEEKRLLDLCGSIWEGKS